jgi:integration host factor subunit beta
VIKNDLVKEIAATFALSHNLSARIVQTLFDKLVDGLVTDSKVELRRFGVFGTKRQAPRVITLPSGKKIKRPAQTVAIFAPSVTLKRKLNPKRKSRR